MKKEANNHKVTLNNLQTKKFQKFNLNKQLNHKTDLIKV